jgi:DNA-binding transcriptional ArsR family regulator
VFVSNRPKSPPGVTRERVRALLDDGLPAAEVARELDISKSVVTYHARVLGRPVDSRFARRFDWAEIQRYYDEGHDFSECRVRFGFCGATWTQAVRRGAIVPRERAAPIAVYLVAGRRTNRHHLKNRLLGAGLK